MSQNLSLVESRFNSRRTQANEFLFKFQHHLPIPHTSFFLAKPLMSVFRQFVRFRTALQVVLQGLGQGFMSTILPAAAGRPREASQTTFRRVPVRRRGSQKRPEKKTGAVE